MTNEIDQDLVVAGLDELLEGTRRYVGSLPPKATEMLDVYLSAGHGTYSCEQVAQIRYTHEAVLFKFYLATLSLEQLWALSHRTRLGLLDALENSLDRLDCSASELLIASFSLENGLFQFCAFLDFYMLFAYQLLGGHKVIHMTRGKFESFLQTGVEEPFRDKAGRVLTCFRSNVFAEVSQPNAFVDPAWGAILQSMRDRVAHRDVLRPSFEGGERLLDKVLFNWPTLRGMTFDRFLQSLQNGSWALLTEDMPEILLDIKWIPGPYTAGMYKNS